MKKVNIALCGAYDILSYGDALFPVALEYELKRRIKIDEVFLFAPVGNVKCVSNDAMVYSYQEMERLHEEFQFSAIIVGGGEMLHFAPICFKDSQDKELVYHEAELWKVPVEFAKSKGIPYYINAVGVAREFDNEQQLVIKEYFKSAEYISVRDIYSFERLRNFVDHVELVPDSLWNINRYLSNEQPIVEGEYVVVQYGTMYQNEELFQVIDEIKRQNRVKIVILPINYCHEDKIFAEKARKYFNDSIIIYDYQLSVEEIFNIIANAKLFIGTSLHGTLTALSNRVYAIVVDMYPSFVGKMDGLVAWTDDELPIISDVRSLAYYVQKFIDQEENSFEDKVETLKIRVDNHFDAIAKKIEERVCNE